MKRTAKLLTVTCCLGLTFSFLTNISHADDPNREAYGTYSVHMTQEFNGIQRTYTGTLTLHRHYQNPNLIQGLLSFPTRGRIFSVEIDPAVSTNYFHCTGGNFWTGQPETMSMFIWFQRNGDFRGSALIRDGITDDPPANWGNVPFRIASFSMTKISQ